MTGYQSKKAMSQDKLVVTDIDGHVVRDARKPKKVALDRDAEIERLNEKIEFLARTNMLYSDWEHRETQVTSDLIRKGIEEAKINTELRAEIAELKTQLAQPAQEPTLQEQLTEEQIWKCNRVLNENGEVVGGVHICLDHQNVVDFARAIEREIGFSKAKLKEKNNG